MVRLKWLVLALLLAAVSPALAQQQKGPSQQGVVPVAPGARTAWTWSPPGSRASLRLDPEWGVVLRASSPPNVLVHFGGDAPTLQKTMCFVTKDARSGYAQMDQAAINARVGQWSASDLAGVLGRPGAEVTERAIVDGVQVVSTRLTSELQGARASLYSRLFVLREPDAANGYAIHCMSMSGSSAAILKVLASLRFQT